jgi:hypothetical protein
MSQPYDPVIQAFFAWVQGKQAYAVVKPGGQERCAFIAIEEVKVYLEDRECRRLVEILNVVFQPDSPPISAANIVPRYVAVFCILLR